MSQKVKVIFFGTSGISVPALHSLATHDAFDVQLVVTQPERELKKARSNSTSIRSYAEHKNIPFFTPESAKQPQLAEKISKLQPTLCILMAYGKIIPPSLLSLPSRGWINIHPSLLPKYRGPSPIQSALLAGERETGVSIILMDAGVDTGPILTSAVIPIEKEDTNETLSDTCANVAASILPHTLIDFTTHTIRPTAQPAYSPTPLTKKYSKDDGRLNFNKTAEELEREIRAFTPWPGTWITYNGEHIRILRARKLASASHQNPGKVSYHNGVLSIAAGNNSALQILLLQRAGKKPLTAQEFVRGFPSFGTHPIG